ncbi:MULTISPECIES: hypothetical protein [Psychrobacter]|uniref:hypothetical protein n=1 Tax=Psychrobacter TaxID=497 RepID=UPI001918735B|nr:hypothetical protein [Psychrobacter maritimus]
MRLPDINDLIQDLQLAKQIAIDDRNPNAIVTATVAQAKLLGMDNMRDVTPNSNGLGYIPELTPEIALAISKRLDEEY